MFVTRTVGNVVVRRAEDWAYTAVDLDASGVIHLQGRLHAFGASVEVAGRPLPDAAVDDARREERRRVPPEVALGLRLTGRLVSCDREGFSDALPHRVLALHFPPDPIGPGARWADGGLLRAFEHALPLDVDVRTSATTLLEAVDPSATAWRARLRHTARLQAGDLGPALELEGRSTWDTEPGALASRDLNARWRPDQAVGGSVVGTLSVQVRRLDMPGQEG